MTREERLIRGREYSRQYRLMNKEKTLLSKRNSYNADKEKHQARSKKYRNENSEKIQQYLYESKLRRNTQTRKHYMEYIKTDSGRASSINSKLRTRIRKDIALSLLNEEQKIILERRISSIFPAKLNHKDYKQIMERQNGMCAICGTTNKLTLDHVIPISKGGKHITENLQYLCHSCNSRKGDTITSNAVEVLFNNYDVCGVTNEG